MEFYVDTADVNTVRQLAEVYPIDGFTTNPKILSQAKTELDILLGEIEQYVKESGMTVFFQVTAADAKGMFAQAKKLARIYGDHLIVKIPAVREGYQAVRLCREAGIRICVTIVHSYLQAVVAAKAGASYVAPYVNHIDNLGADGIRTCQDMTVFFEDHEYPCQVLGASFHTLDQIRRFIDTGCGAITLEPRYFDQMIAHASTDESLAMFRSAWSARFGAKELNDFLP